jgi:hypothetical protein
MVGRAPVHRHYVEQVPAIGGVADMLRRLGELGRAAAVFAGAAGGVCLPKTQIRT